MDVVARALQIGQGLTSRLRALAFSALGMRIDGHCWLRDIEWPRRPHCISLGAGVMLDRRVVLLATADTARITIGARTYLNRDAFLDASERIEIGEECMIGPAVYITDHDHEFRADAAPGGLPLVSNPTRIGARCWLGAKVVVLKGVTIGEGTVVGAGSVVTKSLPPHVVAVGVPARVVKEITA